MKRALAERAKQSLNAAVSNAKEQRHNLEINHAGVSSSLGSRHLPQQPAEISSPPSTSTNNTTSTNNSSRLNASESVSDSLRNCAMINGSFSSLAPVNRSSPSEFSTHPYTDTTAYSITANTTRIPSVQAEVRTNVCAQTDSSTFERPPKVPRLENTQEVPVVPSRDRSATVGATSVSMTQINPILATTSNENKAIKNRNDDTNVFSPPARLAMEPPSVRSAATSDHQSGKLSKKVDETEDDSAFYLKHQNRALATELKSLQFAVSQLEIERDTRRTHCYEALQAMNKLHLVWTDIIDKTIGESVESTVPVRRLLPRLDTAQDLPSTGTADSVEWTRALQNAILLFGQPSQEKNQSNETDEVETAYACLEQSVSNMSAKALTLQEWFIGSKTSVGSASASLPATQSNEIGNSTVSFDHRFYNVKSEMAVVLARCSELEAQLSEMSDSRKEVVSRERRVRRNIYRLAAGMLSPEQVISSLEEGDEDGELAAAVQLEKQQIKIEHHHQLSNRTDAVEDQADDAGMDSRIRRMDHTTLAHIDELQVRVLNLEQMVESGENAIQEVCSIVGLVIVFTSHTTHPFHLTINFS